MSGFDERLQKAIQRGQRSRDARLREAAEKQMTDEEFRRLHNQYRRELSEHIERCMQQLPTHLPGFQFATVVGERGWGAVCSRDDIGAGRGGRRDNFFSRMELVVRPYGSHHVLEITAKGTIRNKEIFQRKHYKPLEEIELEVFVELADRWVLDYAELYSAGR